MVFVGARLRTRISLRIRILMPWSAREQDRGVDSIKVARRVIEEWCVASWMKYESRSEADISKGSTRQGRGRTLHAGEFLRGVHIEWCAVY